MDPTERRLIEAGVSVLVERPEQLLERGLTAEEVYNEAGVANATFYRRFSDKSRYVTALLGGLVAPAAYSEKELRTRVRDAVADSADLDAALRVLVTDVFADVTETRTVARRMLAHLFASTQSLAAQSVLLDYRRRDDLVLAVYDEVFVKGGLTLRRPVTPKAFAVMVNALLEGFALRHRREQAAVTPQSITRALQALLGGLLDTAGHHGHLDDLPSLRVDSGPRAALPRDPRAAVLAAAREEFDKRGYFMTRMSTVAARSGVPIALLRKMFPTKPHVIVGALQPHVTAIEQKVADDRMFDTDEARIVENYLLGCAQMATEHMPFTDALMLALAHDTYGESDRTKPLKEELNLPAIIAPIIEQGQRNGTFATFDQPMDLAAELTNAILLRCFTRRRTPPEENARIISDLVLRGLVAR